MTPVLIPLKNDGERFLPGEMYGSIELEHLHRYRFASQLAQGKDVLDIASGEGYGSAFLAAYARHVTGVDISPDAVAHASSKYDMENLDYLLGSCSDIPMADQSVDVVVSFETIEHHAEHDEMMREIKRVLRPGGILVISSPDKFEYSDRPSFTNPFHVKELYQEEFQRLLSDHFKNIDLYAQRVLLGSALFSRDAKSKIHFESLGSDIPPTTNLPHPQYWVAVASNKAIPKIQGGIFEQSLDDLWREISRQRNTQLGEIIKAVAGQFSNALKAQLGSPWYLQQNSDIVKAGVDPYEHWLQIGITEGRLPAPDLAGFAEVLLSEREQTAQQNIAEKEHELNRFREESLQRQQVLSEQMMRLEQVAAQERNAQDEAARRQMAELAERHLEREQELQQLLSEKERELRQVQQTAYERQRVLEAEIVQAKLKARDEVGAELRTLAERERAFAEQITKLQQESQGKQSDLEAELVQGRNKARDEIEAHHYLLAETERTHAGQMAELAERHLEREHELQQLLSEKERELRQIQQTAYERQRVLEAEIVQAKLKARYEVDAELRTLAERERAFAEQITKLQQESQGKQSDLEAELVQARNKARDEIEAHYYLLAETERTHAGQMAELAERHLEREQELQQLLSEKERELRQVQQTAYERQRVLEAKIVQAELKARDEVNAELLTLEERERAFVEQTAQLRQTAAQELAVQQETFSTQLADLVERHSLRDRELQQVISQKEDQLHQALQQAQVHQQSLSKRLLELQHATSLERSHMQASYASALYGLNAKLLAVQSAWSWRITSPFRRLSALLGVRIDIAPMDGNQFANLMALPDDDKVISNSDPSSANPTVLSAQDSQEMLSDPVSSRTITPAKTIDELLSYDDEAFVTCAYLSLLGRAPDAEGFSYYLGRINNTEGKNGILYQIYRGKEAQKYKADIHGLNKAMTRERWLHRLPIFRKIIKNQLNVEDPVVSSLRRLERQVLKLLGDLLEESRKSKPDDVAVSGALLASFNPHEYLKCNPDVATAGINPYEHYMCFGWKEGRRVYRGSEECSTAVFQTEVGALAKMPDCAREGTPTVEHTALGVKGGSGIAEGIAAYFMGPADDDELQRDGYTFTRLMQYIHSSRLDLQNAFDFATEGGRLEYAKWFLTQAADEYGLTPEVFPGDLLARLVECGGGVAKLAQEMDKRRQLPASPGKVVDPSAAVMERAFGANLVGYAFGEFGMGEHVRMVARSLNAVGTTFCIIDQEVGVHGAGDASVSHWVTDVPRYGINVFHVNADVFPPLYFKLGPSLFAGRYNVGYWAWELSQCPQEFDLSLHMVDEVWAISDFVADSFKTRATVPVVTMPLAVTVLALDSNTYTKAYYGLPGDVFVFYFTFDAASFVDRKNPIALLRAFNRAFPDGNEPVHLLLKTMNIEIAGPLWHELLAEIGDDPRITVISRRMTRDEVLGLNLACDAFVSLHRSEGFGRCVAEAMAYGKPVVVTNYSGTCDFAKEDTACLVGFRLVPVAEGHYPFWQEQVWAEPSVEEAARHMQRLVQDPAFRDRIAAAGQAYVLENFNEQAIGERYAQRLRDIQLARHAPEGRDEEGRDGSSGVASLFLPAPARFQGDFTFTRLMHYIWRIRVDLQRAFDVETPEGRLGFCAWLIQHGAEEYSLTPNVFPVDLLDVLARTGGGIADRARAIAAAQAVMPTAGGGRGGREPGANLVGYAYGEFGMGEQLRALAKSLNSLGEAFCVIDHHIALHGAGDRSVDNWVTSEPRHDVNIVNVNADSFPLLFFKLGEEFFARRYNIGYWAWELPHCPEEFDLALGMVDEVWAISDFVATAFRERAQVPVITMPQAVSVPPLDAYHYCRAYYGLPEDVYLFFFSFDGASYLDRKNPFAVIAAFRRAFPKGTEQAGLLLKTMNVEVAGELWSRLQEAVAGDSRIIILSRRMERAEVLGLNLTCDAFVSLHRSEGFGFCIAEAMAYGKPVIVTNYSGSLEFAQEGTACVVDYKLVPVPAGAYPFSSGQVWAEPDVAQAAAHMRHLFTDRRFAAQLGAAGQRYVLDNLNQRAVGERYARHLSALRERLNGVTAAAAGLPEEAEEIVACIDNPAPGAERFLDESFPVEGWITATQGIEGVWIYVDGLYVGKAHYGILREDIFKAFPEHQGSARSGFCLQIDATILAQGQHRLRVVVNTARGTKKDWSMEFSVASSRRYQDWVKANDAWFGRQRPQVAAGPGSLVSVLLRCGDGQTALGATLATLAAQRHGVHELLVWGEGVPEKIVAERCDGTALAGRYKIARAGDLSSLLASCSGDLVAVLEAGDELRPWAVELVAGHALKQPDVGLFYADEDTLCDAERGRPMFKPAWSPLLLEDFNYIGQTWFARRDALASLASERAAPLQVGTGELLAALGQFAGRVGHIPTVLVSKTQNTADGYRPQGGRVNWLERDAAYPKVSIIMPTRVSDRMTIERCFSALQSLTDYPDKEVIVILNNAGDMAEARLYLARWPFRVLEWDGAFNWSGINNFGTRNASGEVLLFLNDDVEPLDATWLKVLVNTLARPGVEVVGPRLDYPNGTVQHAGVNFVPDGSGSRHVFRFCNGHERDLRWLINSPREVSAVTGACLLTMRACFERLGGFDTRFPLICNDTDYCLRVLEDGGSVVFQPEARLIHHEGISRAGMTEGDDVLRFRARWGGYLGAGDEFTNPNLEADRDDWLVNPKVIGLSACRFAARPKRDTAA